MSKVDDRQKLQAAVSLHQRGNLDEAAKLYRKLIARNPNNHQALHFLGTIEAGVGNIEQAKLLMARSLSIQPPNIQFIENYATILFQTADYKSAVEVCRQGLQLNDSNVSLLYVSAIALFGLNIFQESIAQFDKVLLLQPKHIAALNERGSALAEMKQYDAALASIEKALALNPRYAEAHFNKGNVYGELKRHDEAIAAFDKALALNAGLANAWLGRGNASRELKRYDEAFGAYDKALALKPDLANAWLGRGNVFSELKRDYEALSAYDKALSLKPDLANAWLGRGNSFHNMFRHEEAAAAYAKLLEKEPQHPFAKGLILHQKMLACEWNGIGDLVAEIDIDIASGKRSAEPFGYQAIANSARNFKLCAEIYAAEKFPRSQTPLWRGERYDNGRIRVGYLSGEFGNKVISQLMAGLFELHDRNHFELFAFDNGWDDASELRGRINNAFNTIIDISRLDDLKAATIIKREQIDILVNLNGYFGRGRTGVFAYKPSPIQVSYLGFSATMGADYIDYIIADRYLIPAEHEVFYTEKVVYLPNTYQVNDTKRLIAERIATRAEFNLPDTGFIFCCFSNSFKITPEMFDLWMRLLNKVADSVLWLVESNSAVSRNLWAEAKRRNIAPERLVISPRAKEYSDYLARYRVADLFLDTLPFNAGATASDALWAGLPLLTCSGQTYTARMAGSLLNAVGLPELITQSLDEYESLALKLARNPSVLASLKAKLARNRDTYPLFDTARFTRHIESAYTLMWQRYQRAELPESFAVDPLN